MQGLNKLISRLDFTYEGLSEAGECIELRDEESALKKVISHFKNRQKPVYLFNKNDIEKFNDPQIIEEADTVCEHFIFGYYLGKEINWYFNPLIESSKDPEWIWSLNRHNYWVILARAYAMTGDEKYAREFVSQLKSFTKACPVEPFLYTEEKDMKWPNHAWRTIEAGLRMYASWLPCMVHFKDSPSWDEEGWLCFLNGVHDHAEFLCTHYTNHLHSGNWLTMECSGLFQVGVMFPEFKQAREWMMLGYRRVTHEVRYQFDHEGVHSERTPIYHLTAAGAFLQAYRIAVLNSLPVPPYMLPILEKTAEYLMKLVKPDFTIPMISDADRNSLLCRRADEAVYEGMNLTQDPTDLNEIRAFFRVMSELTGREDFKYFCTGREEGSPPAEKCFSMPDQGFHVMRTGWGSKDSYFMLMGIQLERGERSGHAHLDAGHLELNIAGEDILIDTGRFIYGNNDWKHWRAYFQSAGAHNTVQVDKHIAGTVPDSPAWLRRSDRTLCHRFESTPGYDIVEISHNGFAFMEDPVFHFRRVLYVKPDLWLVDDILTGVGAHEFKLSYNFAPGNLKADPERNGAYIFDSVNTKVHIIPLLTADLGSRVLVGSTEPMGGWVSYGYGKKMPAPQLIYSKTGKVPVRFVTAILRGGNTIMTQTHPGNSDAVGIITNSGASNRYITLYQDSVRIS